MKKLICFILVLAMAASLVACGSSNNNAGSNETKPTNTPTDLTDPGYTFKHNNTEIIMNADAAPIIAALGEPKRYTEEASCAFSGLDKTYDYGNFYLQTYPAGDKDYVYSVWFADDGVNTPEGAYIGMAQADAESIYGAESYNGSNAYILTKGVSKLTLIIKDGVVSSIQYDAVICEG